jgi:TatD DNase family protein
MTDGSGVFGGYLDAHNHLQDDRFSGFRYVIVNECRAVGVRQMVVNGTEETDWPTVAQLAHACPDLIRPSFGLHPWYLGRRSPEWERILVQWLDAVPGAVIGEIGLDRWVMDATSQRSPEFSPVSMPDQVRIFERHLAVARERNVAASIHCLQAWGPMMESLRRCRLPERGFLMHSYGGPVELVEELVRLGAYFSFPGYYAHLRKKRERDVFRTVPPDRLLVETDAPDQPLPDGLIDFKTPGDVGGGGKPTNHPANIRAVHRFLASELGWTEVELGLRVSANFDRLFGLWM